MQREVIFPFPTKTRPYFTQKILGHFKSCLPVLSSQLLVVLNHNALVRNTLFPLNGNGEMKNQSIQHSNEIGFLWQQLMTFLGYPGYLGLVDCEPDCLIVMAGVNQEGLVENRVIIDRKLTKGEERH